MRNRILDQPIDIIQFAEAEFRIKAALFNSNQFKVITLNPEMVVHAEENIEFQAAINNAQMIVPDGAGIIWALKKKGITNNLERVPGIELSLKALEIANELGKKVALYGSTEETINECTNNLKGVFTNIDFVKSKHGFHESSKEEEVANEIANTRPDLVFVALGTPKQEIWINKYSSLFPNSVLIGVGGSFDIWSGKKKRAPGWMIDMNLEWLYRVSSEPQRIPRILKSHPKFVMMVLKEAKAKK